MQRLLLWTGLAGLAGLAGLVLASGTGAKPKPSALALAHGYPPGLYSDAEFSVSDDAAVMVLAVRHAGQSMRLYGDGRLEIHAGEEAFTRRLDRPRVLAIFRNAVDHGLAEFDFDVVQAEISGATCPEGSGRITAHLNFTAYERVSQGKRAFVSKKASLCAPEIFPQVVQSQALIDLAALLEQELATARREGSVDLAPESSYRDATFQLSSDPGQLILRWTHGGGLRGASYSMKLFGDGRLELADRTENKSRELTFAEMDSLVRLVVDHGLAEWDGDRVMRSLSPGLAQRFTDGVQTSGEIHLDRYRRGAYQREPLSRHFTFRNVSMTLSESPDVIELQGLDALTKYAKTQLARGEEDDE